MMGATAKERLYEKMAKEQENYKNWLLSLPKEELLYHCFEYSVREDILFAVEDLTENECQMLLKIHAPLNCIYQDFEKLDSSTMDDIRSCMQYRMQQMQRCAKKENSREER